METATENFYILVFYISSCTTSQCTMEYFIVVSKFGHAQCCSPFCDRPEIALKGIFICLKIDMSGLKCMSFDFVIDFNFLKKFLEFNYLVNIPI